MNLATTKVDSKNILSRTLSNGREAIYNVKTNELVIVHDGTQIGTFFKPTGGINYFKNTLK
jgi:pyocin large subunit-like protein